MKDLSSEIQNQIVEVLKNQPKIVAAYLFGSRALGRAKPGSDIDLAIKGNSLNLDDILSLSIQLDDLMLPYRFDIVDLARADADLQAHINRAGILVYKR